MKTYKYVTRVSESGTIQVQFNLTLINKEVEITIVPKTTKNLNPHKASDFVDRWAGVLKNTVII